MTEGTETEHPVAMRPLVVWSEDPAAAAPLLAALGQDRKLEERGGLDEIAMAVGSGVEIALFYVSAEAQLCQQMAAGTTPSAALLNWRSRAARMLELNRKDRRRVRLVEIAQAYRFPQAFATLFGLGQAVAETALPPEDAVLMLMAQRALRADPEAWRLQAELSAASQDLSGGAEIAAGTPEDAFLTYRRTRDEIDILRSQARVAQEELALTGQQRERLEGELGRSEEEIALLRDQIRGGEQALSEQQERGAALQQALAEAETGLEQLRDEARTAREEMDRAGAAADLLRGQIRAGEEALSQEQDRSAALQQALTETETGLELVRNEARTAREELARAVEISELLRGQIRVGEEALNQEQDRSAALQRALDEAETGLERLRDEADLLKTRSNAVQDELEQLARRRIDLEKALAQAEAEGQTAQEALTLLRSQIRLLQDEHAALKTDRAGLEQRLAQVNQGMESYHAQVVALSTERETFLRRLREKDRSLAAAGGEMQRLEQEVAYLAGQLEALRRQARLQEVESQTELAAHRQALDAQAAEHQRVATEQAEEIAARDRELARILGSKSFRVTQPLRRLRALFVGRDKA